MTPKSDLLPPLVGYFGIWATCVGLGGVFISYFVAVSVSDLGGKPNWRRERFKSPPSAVDFIPIGNLSLSSAPPPRFRRSYFAACYGRCPQNRVPFRVSIGSRAPRLLRRFLAFFGCDCSPGFLVASC